jgi:hypothetical protein
MVMLLSLAGVATAQQLPELDPGYSDMYNLQFDSAHQFFQDWEKSHPEDPLGPVSNACAYLFAEFDRLHILESELFTNDRIFEHRPKPTPDPATRKAFEAELEKADQLAQKVLAKDPNNANALFAKAMESGLRGDYAALIEKRDMAGLGYMKNGRSTAERLLSLHPDYYDAYLAVGIENYLLSLKPAPVRWFLHITGAQTNRETGLQNLRITAEKGRYLLPYARLLLAVAALRDKDKVRARTLLAGLVDEFPLNHLYAKELAKLQYANK